ncbi:hypothetical protein YpB42003004_2172 [Yersinia pestis biovar Antiqua str. B42003004]|nr:hypothetical protein YpB42003004_2172 [Yersinia pestis biovar Antiqua str. B42003004]EDR66897.1 hypothetical protein YpK1973002_1379 [Yersinia pestis biovar Mediaevalis str. K1973002]
MELRPPPPLPPLPPEPPLAVTSSYEYTEFDFMSDLILFS